MDAWAAGFDGFATFADRERLVRTRGPASTSLLRHRDVGSMQRRNGFSVEVKIGVTDSPRELIFNSSQTPDELEKLVTAALTKGSERVAEPDRRQGAPVPGAGRQRIAYLEIGVADSRRVGFGVGTGPVTAPITQD